jgi:Flp pilus assembly protein TadG
MLRGPPQMQRSLPNRGVRAMGRAPIHAFLSGDRDGARGVAAVELALLAPVLIFMLVATFDIGMGLYRKMQVQNAAQAGAQYAISHGFSSSLASTVTGATTFSGISASPAPIKFCGCPTSTGVTVADCSSPCSGGMSPGTYVTVSSQGVYNTILPYPMVPQSFTITAQSTVRIQ